MRVLVTGASGMLGREVAAILIARGDQVTVTQRRPSGLGCREVLGDLGSSGLAEAATRDQDAVVHLAAKVDVVGPWADFRRVNIDGTSALLVSARKNGVSRFVQVSSPSVAHAGRALFGAGAGPADPARARGCYARSKAMGEQIALSSAASDFAVIAVRPHLVWGPGDTQLVRRVVERARSGRLATVGTGACLIDTTYVDNAAEAVVAALDHSEAGSGQAFVVSNGEPRPVAEIIARLCAAAGVAVPRLRIAYPLAWLAGGAVEAVWALRGRISPADPGDPPMTRFLATQLATAHWFDQRHTRAVLGWQPRIDLDEGFRRLAASYRR